MTLLVDISGYSSSDQYTPKEFALEQSKPVFGSILESDLCQKCTKKNILSNFKTFSNII